MSSCSIDSFLDDGRINILPYVMYVYFTAFLLDTVPMYVLSFSIPTTERSSITTGVRKISDGRLVDDVYICIRTRLQSLMFQIYAYKSAWKFGY